MKPLITFNKIKNININIFIILSKFLVKSNRRINKNNFEDRDKDRRDFIIILIFKNSNYNQSLKNQSNLNQN